MVDNKIYVDDWNTVFRKIPQKINEHTFEIMCNSNYFVDLSNYATLKCRLGVLMKDIGNFEYINHLTGDQSIIAAITLSKKYLNIMHIYVAEDAFHGITLKSFRDGILNFGDLYITEFNQDYLDTTIENSSNNSLLILEPFLFYAKYGYEGIEMLKSSVSKAKKKGMMVLFDEIRSGIFCTGSFLFTQKCMPIDVDFICFSKGLALGIPTSVLAVKADVISAEIIKKEDRLKSCMSTSEVAMQRANDMLEYYISHTVSFNEKMDAVTKKITDYFDSFANYPTVDHVNIMGLSCVFVFNNNVKKTKLKLLWTYMISHDIEVRHNEGHLWFLSFALDSTDEELLKVKNTMEEAMELIIM